MPKIKEIKQKKCKMCKRIKATSLIRGKEVCSRCFEIVNRDNYKRIKFGEIIPTNFNLLA